MTALQVICRRSGKPFAPARENFVRGTWRGCPGCRSKATGTPRGDDGPANGEIHQRLGIARPGDTARCGTPQPEPTQDTDGRAA